MDEHQKRRAFEWMVARAGGLGCRVCDRAEYKIDPFLFTIPGAATPDVVHVTSVVLVCDHCGHLSLHSAVKMGLTGLAAMPPGAPAPGPTPRADGGPLPPP